MPSVPSGSTVLVTGANGFIASWVIQHLLESTKSYLVRGAVRSEAKGEHLKNLYSKFGTRFTTVIVEDIEKEGAFDNAVKGVDAIEHIASPFHFRAEDPGEIISPAVKGTIGILESAAKYGSNVKRIVITSSYAAIAEIGTQGPRTFTEKDWNEESPREIAQKGKDAASGHKYRASKTLAEKAAWEWLKHHQGQIKFDIVVTNPGYVFGPIIHEVSSVSQLNQSSLELYNTLHDKRPLDTLRTVVGSYVDVRDVAFAHSEAIEREDLGGERLLLIAGPFSWQDFVDVISGSSISLSLQNLPKGGEGISKTGQAHLKFDNSRTRRLLGESGRDYQFIGIDKIAEDTTRSFLEHGW